MARKLGRDPSISQRNDTSSIGNERRKARRAKTNSNKTDRQLLKKDLISKIQETETTSGETLPSSY